MIYQGSKKLLSKHILPIMLHNRKPNQYFVDLFCGGGNLCQFVDGNVIANDLNKYSISHLNRIKTDTSWIPINNKMFTKEDYQYVKNNKSEFEDYFLGHVGYNLSFGGKWFGGWCYNTNQKDYVKAGYEHVLRQAEKIKHIDFYNLSYEDVDIPQESIIYCDIPYRDTLSYKDAKNFNYDKFYQWCIDKHNEGHKIFISEYNMPDKFKCIWLKEVKMKMDVKTNSSNRVEKLFIVK